MPWLDYLADGLDSDVDLYILSVIGFPDDERRRQHWFDEARNKRTELFLQQYPLEMLPSDDPALRARMYAAARGSRLALGSEKAIGINTAGYRVAAYLLVRVLASRPQRGSLNEAIDAFIRAGGLRVKVSGASNATIRRWWEEYRSAAHLAAAFLYHRHLLLSEPAGLGLLTGYSPMGAGFALAWAESARTAGEQYRVPRARSPLLDSKQTWKAPLSLRLPEVPLDLPPPERITFEP